MKYYLVELSAMNSVKSIRSNCILKAKWFQKPPLEKAFRVCVDNGYSTVNVLSVTRVSKKTAVALTEHIHFGNAGGATYTDNDFLALKKLFESGDEDNTEESN